MANHGLSMHPSILAKPDYLAPFVSSESLFDVGSQGAPMFYAACTSKKQLQNTNAVKFKLNNLVMSRMRYQVVYKKLVRSMRKFYGRKFFSNGYHLSKEDAIKFMSDVRDFIAAEFSTDMKKLNYKLEDLA